jgi:hypothetical protein
MVTDTKPRTPGTHGPEQGQRVPSGRSIRSDGTRSQAQQRTKQGRVTSPRHTRPLPSSAPSAAGRPEPALYRRRQQRMPFILLLVGLLGGALISLLVISTTLDEGSYDINTLTAENNQLYKQQQALDNEVANLQNPAVIASEASGLGLRRQPDDRFLNPATGGIQVVPAVTPEP